MTATIFRTFLFGLVFIFGLVVMTALLPSHYQAHAEQTIAVRDVQTVKQYLNVENWQELLTPQSDLQLSFLTQAQQVGGYGELAHPWGLAEITVLSLNEQGVTVQIRFDTEHVAHIQLAVSQQEESVVVTLSAKGENHAPLVGGLYARFAAYYVEQQLKMMMNQIVSQLKLHRQG
ncbi:hypothetical protein CWB99_04570 [Pseudoalteromonas rubra]|uniref:Polyketide cyclase n=1 Tax=Pseudoalteromonas rubra TaxID=43658 RepID=A0A5S3WSX4_9GAMM|nr:hypothetical protein [Pseudoalteromonas rubra]TMP31532.1 hypothetical protein CWB99_04570 [Pseudoalteromonas rubra]TMP34616.1 hypothetical protein CWC00_07475 [Pseudoalteromonas rubra]